jgi:hypothetical protein
MGQEQLDASEQWADFSDFNLVADSAPSRIMHPSGRMD